jgi:hypothetical protein
MGDDIVTFIHRRIYHGRPQPRFCADCGEQAKPEWVNVTGFGHPAGEQHFVHAPSYWPECPNGPHEIHEADRG